MKLYKARTSIGIRIILLASATLTLLAGCSSRARVESLTAMNEGVDLATRKNWRGAITAMERAAALDPTNDQAFFNLAIAHMELREFEGSEEALEHAVALVPANASYAEKLGTVRMEIKDWTGAGDALKAAVSRDAKLYRAQFKLGQVAERNDDPQEALYAYTKAVEVGPRFLPSYSSLGRLYADLDYTDNALQVLHEGLRASEVIPQDAEVPMLHHLLGTVFQQQKKYDEAIKEFQTSLSYEGGNSDSLFGLGWTYGLTGNAEEAIRYLKRFVATAGPDTPEWYMKAARDRVAELELNQANPEVVVPL